MEQTIHQVDLTVDAIDRGACLKAVNEALDWISGDVVQRQDLKKPRVINLKISMTPDVVEGVEMNLPKIEWEVARKAPGSAGNVTTAMVKDGKVLVNRNDLLAPQSNMENIAGFDAAKEAAGKRG